jgi:hypothetical protein
MLGSAWQAQQDANLLALGLLAIPGHSGANCSE